MSKLSKKNEQIQNFWKLFCSTLPQGEQQKWRSYDVDAWAFGDSADMANDLLASVLSGEKTATTGMYDEYIHENEDLPQVGDRSIILDGEGNPRLVVEVTNVIVQKFGEVDEDFALKEGEGFKSLEQWRTAHEKFFQKYCRILNIPFSHELMVVCEEFKILFKNNEFAEN